MGFTLNPTKWFGESEDSESDLLEEAVRDTFKGATTRTIAAKETRKLIRKLDVLGYTKKQVKKYMDDNLDAFVESLRLCTKAWDGMHDVSGMIVQKDEIVDTFVEDAESVLIEGEDPDDSSDAKSELAEIRQLLKLSAKETASLRDELTKVKSTKEIVAEAKSKVGSDK